MNDNQIVDNQISDARIHELQYKRNNGEALTIDENRFLDNLEQGKVGLTPTPEFYRNLQARKKNGEQLTPEEEAQITRGDQGSQPKVVANGPDNSSGPSQVPVDATKKGTAGTADAGKRSK